MTHTETSVATIGPERDAASGAALALGAFLEVGFMAMHPPGVGTHDRTEFFAEAARIADVNAIVHGSLAAILLALVFGFVGLSRALGLGRPLVRLGLVSYAGGAIALALAAVLNGIVFARMVERFAEASASEQDVAHVVMAFSFQLNQALAACGVVATSVAVLAWSLALLRHPGSWRWIGGLGTAIGAGAAVLFLSGNLALDLFGFGGFVAAQALWTMAVGVRSMLRP